MKDRELLEKIFVEIQADRWKIINKLSDLPDSDNYKQFLRGKLTYCENIYSRYIKDYQVIKNKKRNNPDA